MNKKTWFKTYCIYNDKVIKTLKNDININKNDKTNQPNKN